LEEHDSVVVTIENLEQLDSVKVDVEIRDFEYNPKNRKSYANFQVKVFAKKVGYLYGGLLISGTPNSEGIITKALDPDKLAINEELNRLKQLAVSELGAIQSEIAKLLQIGAPRVKVDFAEILERILVKLESKE